MTSGKDTCPAHESDAEQRQGKRASPCRRARFIKARSEQYRGPNNEDTMAASQPQTAILLCWRVTFVPLSYPYILCPLPFSAHISYLLAIPSSSALLTARAPHYNLLFASLTLFIAFPPCSTRNHHCHPELVSETLRSYYTLRTFVAHRIPTFSKQFPHPHQTKCA